MSGGYTYVLVAVAIAALAGSLSMPSVALVGIAAMLLVRVVRRS